MAVETHTTVHLLEIRLGPPISIFTMRFQHAGDMKFTRSSPELSLQLIGLAKALYYSYTGIEPQVVRYHSASFGKHAWLPP